MFDFRFSYVYFFLPFVFYRHAQARQSLLTRGCPPLAKGGLVSTIKVLNERERSCCASAPKHEKTGDLKSLF